MNHLERIEPSHDFRLYLEIAIENEALAKARIEKFVTHKLVKRWERKVENAEKLQITSKLAYPIENQLNQSTE